MSRLVLLDSGPVGLVTNPKGSEGAGLCNAWLAALAAAGVRVVLPEGVDYEVRRGLFLKGKRGGLDRLDKLARKVGYLPVTIAVWQRASEVWARARKGGYATADKAALDFDVILAAQAELATEDGYEVTVATSNVGHLGRYVHAQTWETITV